MGRRRRRQDRDHQLSETIFTSPRQSRHVVNALKGRSFSCPITVPEEAGFSRAVTAISRAVLAAEEALNLSETATEVVAAAMRRGATAAEAVVRDGSEF